MRWGRPASRPQPTEPLARRSTRLTGRLRVKARIIASEPRPPGGVCAPLSAQLADRRPVDVLDGGILAQLQRPSECLQPPAEVGVLSGAQALAEAAGGLERRASDEQVRRRRARAERVRQMRPLGEEVAPCGVARRERRRGARRRADLTREGPHPVADRKLEVAVEQVRRCPRIGVEKEDEVARRVRSAGVAGVRGRPLALSPG